MAGQVLTPKLVNRVQTRPMVVHRPPHREPSRPMNTSRRRPSRQMVPEQLVLNPVGGRPGLHRELRVVMNRWPQTLSPTRARPGTRDTQVTSSITLFLRLPPREQRVQRNEPGASMPTLVERRRSSPVHGSDVTVLVVPRGQTHPARHPHHRTQAGIGASVLLI